MVGKEFAIETDHKPLVPVLGSRGLDDLPIRIQCFKLRLFRFQYTISYVPGKELVSADTLYRQPATPPETLDTMFEVEEYISAIIQSLPASEEKLRQISTMQDQDEVCHQVKLYAKTDWPSPANLKGEIKLYWSLRDHLTVQNELLLRDARIVIPPPLRKETLDAIHLGHQGITKCRERAKHSVWWSGLSSQIDEIVSKCPVCAKEKHNRAEPLLCTQFQVIRGKPLRPTSSSSTDDATFWS